MPPKAPLTPAPPSDEAAAAPACADASAADAAASPAGDAVSSEPETPHQALSDAVFCLLGLPLEKLEEQLQGLR